LLTNFPFKTMSHQFTSGVFLNSQPAWHKLGTVLDGTLPAREAFRIANADWETIAAPIFTADMVEIPGHKAITRADNGSVLSVQNESYTIVQNEQLIRMAEALHEDTTMDAVCVLAGGKRVTFTAKLNGAVGEVVKGDEVQQHLVGCTSHDGTIAFQLIFSPIRVVCQNTLSAALGHAAAGSASKRMRIRHTKNANSLIEQLPQIIDIKRQQFNGGLEELKAMAAKPCTSAQFRQYCESVFADQLMGFTNDRRGDKTSARPKQLTDLPAWDKVANKFHGEGIGFDIQGVKGTMWGAYQAITEYFSHDAGRAIDATESARQRLESLYWGTGATTIARAHELALR
jgi:phage/plasmid-like protein (TIGR03299 family)